MPGSFNAFIFPELFGDPSLNFQANLAAATSDAGTYVPHHPITCQGKLYFDEHGEFGCEHITVPADDSRTKRVVIHSFASLIIELGYAFQGIDPETGLAILRPEE